MKRIFKTHKKTSAERRGSVDNFENSCETMVVRGLSNLYSPQVTKKAHVRDVIDVLYELEIIDSEQVDKIRSDVQNKIGSNVELVALRCGIAVDDILRAKAKLYGFGFRHISTEDVDKEAFDILELNHIRSSHIMPIAIKDGVMVVATSDPANVFAIDDVKRRTDMDVEVLVCNAHDIDAVCDEFDDSKFSYDVDEIISDMDDIELVTETEENIDDLEKSAGESPVIKFVNYLLTSALHEGASDIHIEPKEKYTKIRYRVDGVLFDSRDAPAKMHPAMVSRLKIMSNLDISERRLPQDGKIAVIIGGRGVDLRVSVLPTSHGEKVVIRILDRKSISRGLDESGMEPDILKVFQDQIALPNGILLVTGPTGSGKSTTLYSALGQMDSQHLNVSTVEDPVEYELEFCNQIQVNERVGMTFAAALRSLLRQDPDIIMMGEIRDNETARIAVQAALTGHLVLSTLHTNDAPSSISRLVNIGIEPYLIAASLNAILAQRLVRRICPNCKESYKVPEKMRQYIPDIQSEETELMHGAGCDQCRGSGYLGRVGIYELMVIDEVFRDIINKDSSVNNMRLAFAESKQPNLFDDGMKKVKQGLTTMEEVLRVTQVYGQNAEEVFVANIAGDEKSNITTKKDGTDDKDDESQTVLAAIGGDSPPVIAGPESSDLTGGQR